MVVPLPDPEMDHIKRRAHPRVAVDLKSDFQVLQLKNQNIDFMSRRIDSMTKTLGTGGLMFVSHVPLPIGAKVDMKLHYYTIVVEFVAEVVWTKEEEGFGASEYFCGSRYSAISYDNLTHIQNILKSHQTH